MLIIIFIFYKKYFLTEKKRKNLNKCEKKTQLEIQII